MISSLRLPAVLCAAFLALAVPQSVRADEFTPAQQGAIEKIVHDYLLQHPEGMTPLCTMCVPHSSSAMPPARFRKTSWIARLPIYRARRAVS